MIYTCRFCDWQSIYPIKLTEHVDDNHELILKTVKVRENRDSTLAIETEQLIRNKIWVCDNKGFLKPDIFIKPNRCRFCDIKLKDKDKTFKHMESDHQEQEIELEVRILGDGFVVTVEELERKHISVK